MSVWGKIFGSVAGFAVGGPVGGLLGAALGHAADKGTLFDNPPGGWGEGWKNRLSPDPMGASTFVAAKMAATLGQKEQVYSLCLIVLAAKLAKSDGPVNRTEINAFKKLLNIPQAQTHQIGQLFDNARQRTDDFEAFAQLLRQTHADNLPALEDMLKILYNLAMADVPSGRSISPQEEAFLRKLHAIFGLSIGAWDRIENGTARPSSNPDHAYRILGVKMSASNEEIRMAWKKLVRDTHPDILSARGVSQAELSRASEKIARINAAWDQIKRDRKI